MQKLYEFVEVALPEFVATAESIYNGEVQQDLLESQLSSKVFGLIATLLIGLLPSQRVAAAFDSPQELREVVESYNRAAARPSLLIDRLKKDFPARAKWFQERFRQKKIQKLAPAEAIGSYIYMRGAKGLSLRLRYLGRTRLEVSFAGRSFEVNPYWEPQKLQEQAQRHFRRGKRTSLWSWVLPEAKADFLENISLPAFGNWRLGGSAASSVNTTASLLIQKCGTFHVAGSCSELVARGNDAIVAINHFASQAMGAEGLSGDQALRKMLNECRTRFPGTETVGKSPCPNFRSQWSVLYDHDGVDYNGEGGCGAFTAVSRVRRALREQRCEKGLTEQLTFQPANAPNDSAAPTSGGV